MNRFSIIIVVLLKIMKRILIIIVFILTANWTIADDIEPSPTFYNELGYRVISSKILEPTSWEKKKFDILEKSINKIKSVEQVQGEPNWYYRFEVTIERLPDKIAAAKRVKRLLKKPPGLSPSENKAFPLRKAFQAGTYVYTVSTDVYLYYNTELDQVLNALRKNVEQRQ